MHSCQVGATVIWEYTKQVSLSSLSGVVMDLNHLRINQDASSPATPLETELLPGLLLFLFFDPQWVFVGINLPKSAQRFQPPRDCRTPRFGNQFIMNHMNNLFFKHLFRFNMKWILITLHILGEVFLFQTFDLMSSYYLDVLLILAVPVSVWTFEFEWMIVFVFE